MSKIEMTRQKPSDDESKPEVKLTDEEKLMAQRLNNPADTEARSWFFKQSRFARIRRQGQ